MPYSEVQPEGGVRKDTCEGEVLPQLSVCEVSLGGDFEGGEFGGGGCSGQDLASFLTGVDLQEHEFAGFVLILQLSDQREVVGVHVGEPHNGGLICLGILGLGVATVEDAGDLSRGHTCVVILEILQIERYPTTVHKDATLLTLIIQMCVEWCDDFDSLFSVSHLLHLNLFRVVEDTSDFDLLEGVIVLELI